MAKFILWAIPKGKSNRLHERPLTSFPLTSEQAARVQKAASKEGWHSFRKVVDTNELPDFTAGIKK